MRRVARRVWWPGAVVAAAIVLATPAPAPARSADPAVSAAAKKKPKPVTCKPAQARVKLRGGVRCVTLPKIRADGDARLTLLRELIRRDPGTVRTRRGKRIGPLWSAGGGRLKRVRTRLLRVLPKVLRFADGVSARASAIGDRNCTSGPATRQTGSFDGFSVTSGSNGDVAMDVAVGAGYAIQVEIGGAIRCSDLRLPECPMPDGALDGTDGRSSIIGFRLTKDGALVQSLRTVVRTRQTMTAKVAVDAKLDEMQLEDIANEGTSFRTPDATFNFGVAVIRRVTIDMRTGRPKGTPEIEVNVRGITGSDRLTQEYRVRRAFEQSFSDVMSEEIAAYRRRETAWQTPGTCAKVVFAPPTDTIKVKRNQNGTVQPHVEANAGGTAAKAKWTVSAQENGTFSPTEVEAPSPAITYRPTGRNGQKLRAKFRATSTAGVAGADRPDGTWSQEIEDPPADAFYVVDGVTYDANHSSTFSGPGLPCDVDGNTTDKLTINTPRPFLPETGKLAQADGSYSGIITLDADAPKARRGGIVHGCDINADPPPPPCDTTVGEDVVAQVGIIVTGATSGGTAKVTWVLPAIVVGDGGPGFPCYTPTVVGAPLPEERQVPSDEILSPGAHTLSVTRNADLGPGGAAGKIVGTTQASITFHRVNEDGSPYTG
jgi:hypothetical protein